MRQVFSKVLILGFLFYAGNALAVDPVTPAVQPNPYAADPCASEKEAWTTYSTALASAKGSNFGSAVSSANSCVRKDAEFDPDDTEFDCDEIEENCPGLYSEGEERLRKLKEEMRREEKDLDKELRDERKEQADLKKEAAELAKDYAEKEDDLNEEIVKSEKEYKDDLKEKDKEALSQVHEIQETIRKIADENRKIVLAANRAMADLAKAKLNARTGCRDQARKDYQATLKQLDEELAKRGGRISGGFEGIQNAENYRKFLVGKIKNPEPSENFNLCYSAGDAVENNLQQSNMNGALNMNEFTSQIEENNKQRDQLTEQLKQQQQLAQQQKIEGYQEHMTEIQAIQKKILTNRQNYERESRAHADKQRQVDEQVNKLKADYQIAVRRAKNAETRYNCLDHKNLLTSTPVGSSTLSSNVTGALSNAAGLCGPSNTCAVCESVRSAGSGTRSGGANGAASGGSR